MKLTIVTATVDPFRTSDYWETWRTNNDLPLVMIVNGQKVTGSDEKDEEFLKTHYRPNDVVHIVPDYLGTVPAFSRGAEIAIAQGADLVCCFHDDVEIHDDDWADTVKEHFSTHSRCLLAGFGGALGIGRKGMYTDPYDPMTLARHSFGSNMEYAEEHGARWSEPREVAVLDGFSQIFRIPGPYTFPPYTFPKLANPNLFAHLDDLGIVHHAYDAAMSCIVRKYGYETWFLPVRCHHAGGVTAVADAGYQEWAKTVNPRGDQGLWEKAHRIVYDQFDDVLPFRVDDRIREGE